MSDLLPDKLLPVAHTVVGRGAVILALLQETTRPPGQLYILARESHPSMTYDEFVEALTLLFAAGIVHQTNGIIGRE